MTATGFPNLIGIDDAPFPKSRSEHPQEVPLVATVFADDRFDGVLYGKVHRDGDDATDAIAALIRSSRFDDHAQAVLLQGITFGGFNVVDIHRLHALLERPIIAVTRRQPDRENILRILREKIPNGAAKAERLAAAPRMQPCEPLWIQWVGTERPQAEATVRRHQRHGHFPEPLRLAHLLGAAYVLGHSHGGA